MGAIVKEVTYQLSSEELLILRKINECYKDRDDPTLQRLGRKLHMDISHLNVMLTKLKDERIVDIRTGKEGRAFPLTAIGTRILLDEPPREIAYRGQELPNSDSKKYESGLSEEATKVLAYIWRKQTGRDGRPLAPAIMRDELRKDYPVLNPLLRELCINYLLGKTERDEKDTYFVTQSGERFLQDLQEKGLLVNSEPIPKIEQLPAKVENSPKPEFASEIPKCQNPIRKPNLEEVIKDFKEHGNESQVYRDKLLLATAETVSEIKALLLRTVDIGIDKHDELLLRAAYQLSKEGTATTTKTSEIYKKLCEDAGIRPLHYITINGHWKKLEIGGYVTRERVSGKFVDGGNGVRFLLKVTKSGEERVSSRPFT
jgi:DNA-binding PadR family transcriptional regulator